LNIHEVDGGQATFAKYVMLPNGKVIPFRQLLLRRLSALRTSSRYDRLEDRALTDQEIAERLREYEFFPASPQRTVSPGIATSSIFSLHPYDRVF